MEVVEGILKSFVELKREVLCGLFALYSECVSSSVRKREKGECVCSGCKQLVKQRICTVYPNESPKQSDISNYDKSEKRGTNQQEYANPAPSYIFSIPL